MITPVRVIERIPATVGPPLVLVQQTFVAHDDRTPERVVVRRAQRISAITVALAHTPTHRETS